MNPTQSRQEEADVRWTHERYPILRVTSVELPDGTRFANARGVCLHRPTTGASRPSGQIQTGFAPSGRGMPMPIVRVV